TWDHAPERRAAERSAGRALQRAHVVRIRTGDVLEAARDRVERIAEQPELIRLPVARLKELPQLRIEPRLIELLRLLPDTEQRLSGQICRLDRLREQTERLQLPVALRIEPVELILDETRIARDVGLFSCQ